MKNYLPTDAIKNWFSKEPAPEEATPVFVSSFPSIQEWPSNAELYANIKEQELLIDTARFNVAETLLKVHDLIGSCKIQRRSNAEHIYPDAGPFIRVNNNLTSYESLVPFLSQKGYSLSLDLESNKLVQGMISMIKLKLEPIEEYFTWVDERNLLATYDKYECSQPEPLRTVLFHRKKKSVMRRLKYTGWLDKSQAEIIYELQKIFKLVVDTLGENQSLFENILTEADVYMYGHLQAILTMKLPNPVLLNTLNEFKQLKRYVLIFQEVHLRNKSIGIWEFV